MNIYAKNRSYVPNYYSLIDIMATEEKVPYQKTQVLTNLERRTHVTLTSENGDLSLAPFDVSLSGSGAQTTTDSSVTLEQSEGEQELAFWMLNDADDLHNYYVKINVPELYRSLNKSICEAGANSVDLGKLCKYFYEFGLHVSKFDDHNTIENMLLNTLRQRLTHIIDMCNCADVKSKRDSHFDCSEEKLYSSGCETFSAYHNWLTRDATESRIRNGKRKRSQMEVDDILKL
ncbi:DNA replication complex GINS protein PSF3 isoform X2 [Phlebotomus argentipes]|uniref:DNA replication complex GINS protein PSF3 isoform X2 n=1 Tax=Phlebotomus argentipes TaxID=94469 RepID=UPI002892AD6B|nr:DNA replication complex GINS protein PSF3 isoform X2 [Phlebotomus argentipes]